MRSVETNLGAGALYTGERTRRCLPQGAERAFMLSTRERNIGPRAACRRCYDDPHDACAERAGRAFAGGRKGRRHSMNITITFRHMVGTDAVKQYAHDKIAKLQKFLRQAMTAQVTLSVEGLEHIA